MDGIEIITKEVIREPNMLVYAISCMMIILGLIILAIIVAKKPEEDWCGLILFCIVLSALLVCGVYALCTTVFAIPTDRYEYTAKIDESVSLVEFYDDYTNIRYEDGIWHFEDKE